MHVNKYQLPFIQNGLVCRAQVRRNRDADAAGNSGDQM